MMVLAQRPALQAGMVFVVLLLPAVLFGWLLRPILVPLLLAAVLFVLLEPLVSLLQRHGLSRVLAIGLILLVTLGLVVWLVIAVVPLLIEQFSVFRARLPQAWENFSGMLHAVEGWVASSLGIGLESGSLLRSITGPLQTWSGRAVASISGWLTDLALWLVLVPLILFFLLRDYSGLRNQLINRVPNRYFEKTLMIYFRVVGQLESYVRGVMLQSVIMATVAGAGFFMIGLPMAFLLGLLAGIFNLIPYLGPLLGLVPPLLVALSSGAEPDVLAAIALVMLVAQLNDNLLVVPTILARAANLHPLVALLGIIVAGNLFGLLGMVFALPIMATGRIVYSGLATGLSADPMRG